jgi:hypothetical protein
MIFPDSPVRFRVLRGSLAAVILLLAVYATARACPFCGPIDPPLSDQVSRRDVVALGKWTAAVKPAGELAGRTTFEALQVVKAPREGLKRGQRIDLPRFVAGREGDLFLLTASAADNLAGVEWDAPVPVTETAFQYVARAPSREAPAEKRLPYYLKYLEYPDPFIADDAYSEFAQASYAEVAAIKDRFSRSDLRAWLTDPDLVPTRRGLYGLMLGLCGTAEDARFLEEQIVPNVDEFRFGIDGLIGGYLLLTGERGLDVIDRAKLSNEQAPAGELFAAMAALRFFWTYGDGRISQERLRESMRRLLDRRDVVDLAIADLARWKDWSVQDRLAALYSAEDFEDEAFHQNVKRAIIRYFLACTRDAASGSDGDVPDHVTTARRHLAKLREKDPALVRQAERFFAID